VWPYLSRTFTSAPASSSSRMTCNIFLPVCTARTHLGVLFAGCIVQWCLSIHGCHVGVGVQ
jgi:hypothetical protein